MTSSAASAKLKHHVKQACLSNPDFLAGSISLQPLLAHLKAKHVEYRFEAAASLFEKVLQEARSYVSDDKSISISADGSIVRDGEGGNGVMSSNNLVQAGRAGGAGGNNPSKRQRPDDAVATAGSQSQYNRNQARGGEESAPMGSPAAAPPAAAPAVTGEVPPVEQLRRKKVKMKVFGNPSSTVHGVPVESDAGQDFLVPVTTARLADLAGMEAVVEQVNELVFVPMKHPQVYTELGVRPPCGILLRGPSGVGKTHLANAVAAELGLPYYRATGPELIGGTSGESEERIRDLFAAATLNAPSVLFLDAVDVIAAKVEGANARGMDKRVIAQLLDCIDQVSALGEPGAMSSEGAAASAAVSGDAASGGSGGSVEKSKLVGASGTGKPGQVVLICASSKPDSLDPSLRGRLSRELSLPVPDAKARTLILRVLMSKMKLAEAVDVTELGRLTPGFVGADLRSLCREAGMLAAARVVRDLGLVTISSPAPANDTAEAQAGAEAHAEEKRERLVKEEESAAMDEDRFDADPSHTDTAAVAAMAAVAVGAVAEAAAAAVDLASEFVKMEDFMAAIKSVQPSAKREGFAVVPDVSWADVGALAGVRDELQHNVLEPIANPERFRALGLEVPAGVLFFGPPGCGKTLLAKAVANQSGANFISVKGPELLNMYVGESESRVRQVFSRARASAPCVIFFDELDALCPRRGSGDSGNGVSERVVNQLLTELDGLESRKDVYIIAATNRLELIDDAMLRPGRLGKLLYVPLPIESDRCDILTALTRKVNVLTEEGHVDAVDLRSVSQDKRTNGFSGADLAALVREAGLEVIREDRAAGNLAINVKDGPAAHTATIEVPVISRRHFDRAMDRCRPSVREEDRMRYDRVNSLIQSGVGAIQALQNVRDS